MGKVVGTYKNVLFKILFNFYVFRPVYAGKIDSLPMKNESLSY